MNIYLNIHRFIFITLKMIANEYNSIVENSGIGWSRALKNLEIKDDEVHVWLVRLDGEIAKFELLLSSDECARAERFRFAVDKQRFIVARSILRIILAKYLPTSPAAIEFEYEKCGKPFLSKTMRSSIKFNVSHSENMALFAITGERKVGIDIKKINPSLIDDGMVAQILTAREIVQFRAMPNDRQNSFFFDCWALKEAYLKARGCGLSLLPANQIETSSFLKSPFGIFDNESQKLGWSAQKLPSIPNYAAALVVEGMNPKLKFLIVPDSSLMNNP